MASNKRRDYRVEPHPKGLGFVAIEIMNGKATWRSQDHCDEEFCRLEIDKRKKRLEVLNNVTKKKYKWGEKNG
ncbi:Uncharacterised protein [Rodentibacter pneumotropicus]|uniref:Uncharacterized protein n=1 Tax=Rodentibacter pneumotropicus TaxID=758 RepID=A0A3S4U9Z3_9PAST|nr:Uncharacterised protein [Rodentibacter pneumotropicus]